MIDQGTIDRIRDAARVEEVVGDFVSLKKRGASYVACCPFHNEKTPSFHVTPSRGIFKCFGCGEAGDSISFLMKHESMSYVEALKYLAKKYGIEVVEKELTAEEIASRQRMESLHVVSDFAQDFYVKQLQTGMGRTLGYQYLKSRGMEDTTIKDFGLGWAPSGRDPLLKAARGAGFKDEYLIAAGLVVQREDGTLADMFHERVMFPIHSISGRVIAYSGRTLRTDDSVPKYKNSNETELYVKSRSLFGIFLAKGEISKKDKCILVEGNVDVVSMHQLGFKNVVASCGTALTLEQVRLIHRFTDNITLMYDGDGAGIKAALKGIGLILSEGLNIKLVLLPDKQDPDDFARKHTYEQVEQYIKDNERDFISFKTDMLLRDSGNDPVRRADVINEIANTIALVPDPVKRTVFSQQCAQHFGVDLQILAARIQKDRDKVISGEANRPEAVETAPDLTRENDKDLAGPERILLEYVLRYGRNQLLFDKDSEFWCEEPFTVFEFIDSVLNDDNVKFSNDIYRAVYGQYGIYYDEGLSQDEIQSRFISGMDREMSDLVSKLVIDTHELSVESFRSTLTKTSTMLVKHVPMELLRYQVARIDKRQKEIKTLLVTVDEQQQAALMSEFAMNNKFRNHLNQKLKVR